MKVLVTGAFGNIGTCAVEELLEQGHSVRCLDLKSRRNERVARKFAGKAEIMWGDLRRHEDVARAVQGRDVVVHLAFIIPKLSATGVDCEARPDWAYEINVGGTRNLIEAMKAAPTPPRFIFASSCHVYGLTQDLTPPRTASDPVHPVEHYSRHKIECERMIRESGLEWTILRFAAALPLELKLDRSMFDVPLDNRIEFVHRRDVGLAVANAVSCEQAKGKTLLIGGGPRCRFYYREIVERILGAMGIGMLPEEAFSTVPFAVDWLDTRESQSLLHYQRHDLDDYIREMLARLGYRRYLTRAFAPIVRHHLIRQSPYLPRARSAWTGSWMTQVLRWFKRDAAGSAVGGDS